jgi:hypothetical protein
VGFGFWDAKDLACVSAVAESLRILSDPQLGLQVSARTPSHFNLHFDSAMVQKSGSKSRAAYLPPFLAYMMSHGLQNSLHMLRHRYTRDKLPICIPGAM